MNCPSCGKASPQGFNYCKNCGANLTLLSNTSVSKLVSLAWSIPLAMAVITLGGLGMLFYIGLELTRRGGDASLSGLVMMLADLLAVLLIDWMLIRQLSRVIDIYRPTNEAVVQQLSEVSGKQIEGSSDPASFVTERTTRLFEPSARDEADRLS